MTKEEKEMELALLKIEAIKHLKKTMDKYFKEKAEREKKARRFTMINTIICVCILLIVIIAKWIFSLIK